jgi:predicted nucleic acid-binding protein
LSGFAVDASATIPWCIADEATPATEALLERLQSGDEAIVPAHWPVEVMNALTMAVRRQRLTFSQVLQFAKGIASLTIRIAPPTPVGHWDSLLKLASQTRLTLYDAAYLQLAMQTGVPLATLDKELKAAARSAGVALIDLA